MTTFPTTGFDYFFDNNNGDRTLQVLNDAGAAQTYFHTDGSIDTTPTGNEATNSTQISLYPGDNHVANFVDDDNSTGAIQIISFSDFGPFQTFGPDNDLMNGEIQQEEYIAPDGTRTTTTFSFGHISDFHVTGVDANGNNATLDVTYNFATNLSTLTTTVTNTDGVVLSSQVLTGPGNVDYLIGNDGSSLIGNAGGTLIGNDGSSLISQDGGSLISNDGGSLIGNDGSSIALDGSSFVANAEANLAKIVSQGGGNLVSQGGGNLINVPISALISNDGATLLAQSATQLISQDGGGLLPVGTIVGTDGIVALGAAENTNAIEALNGEFSLMSLDQTRGNPASDSASAGTATWGGGSGNWNDPAHWSGGAVPGALDQATIGAPNVTVTINTDQDVKVLNVTGAGDTVVEASGGTVNVANGLTVGKGVFDLQQGGTIVGGVLSTSGGKFGWQGGTLDGSTFDGNLDLSTSSADPTTKQPVIPTLHIVDGLTVNAAAGSTAPGTISITGANSQLFFDGSQFFDNALIKLGSAAAGFHFEQLVSDDPTNSGDVVLTLGPSVTIDQTGAGVSMTSTDGTGEIDFGGKLNATFAAKNSSFYSSFSVNASTFINDGGDINVANGDEFDIAGTTVTNTATAAINVSAGGQATIIANSFDNEAVPNETQGELAVDGAKSSLTIEAAWTNAGLISISNGGAFHSDGEVTTAGLGQIDNPDNQLGGTFYIDGTLDNTGATLDLSSNDMGKMVLNGATVNGVPAAGTIVGGTINDPNSDLSYQGGTLDGVTIDAPLELSGAGPSALVGPSVIIVGGITATTDGGAAPGEIDVNGPFSSLEFDGTETIDNITINLGGPGLSPAHTEDLVAGDPSFTNATLTFGADATINMTGPSVVLKTSADDNSIVLDGTLNVGAAPGTSVAPVTNGSFELFANAFTNNGTINVNSSNVLTLLTATTSPFVNDGSILIDGGVMVMSRAMAAASTGSITITGGGVLDIGTDAPGQTITFAGAGELELDQPSKFTGSIAGIGAGDSIDLTGIGLATITSYDGTTLTLEAKGKQLQLTVSGLPASGPLGVGTFSVTKDKFGTGSLITPVAHNATWKSATNGTFDTAADWLPTPGVVPTATYNALITAGGTSTYTVSSANAETVFSLATAKGATLDIQNASTFTSLSGTGVGSQANAGTIRIEDGSTLLTGGSIDNTGTIDLHSSATTTLWKIRGNVSLLGTGNVTLDEDHSQIVSDGNAATLTNANTISGVGVIGDAMLSLVNKATIAATGTDALVVQAGRGGTNTGTMEATAAGGLLIRNMTLTNSAGTIKAAGASAHVDLDHATIVGGSLSGAINVISTAVLEGVSAASPLSNAGPVTIGDGHQLVLAGAIKNNGSGAAFALHSTGDVTQLTIDGAVNLSGNGDVTMTDDSHNLIDSNGAPATLTTTNFISGAGTIGDNALQVVNKGSITATGTNNALVLTGAGGFANGGVIEAKTQNLIIRNTSVGAAPGTSGGTIKGDAASVTGLGVVEIDNASIEAGNLLGTVATATGTTDTLGGSSAVPTITGKVHVVDNSTLDLAGTINNSGAIDLESTGGDKTTLAISGNVTLTGAGTVAFLDNGNNLILNTNGNATLTNNGNSITGNGVIGNVDLATSALTLNNKSGNITATGGVMILSAAVITNTAVLAASGSNATLDLTNTTINNDTNGSIRTATSGSLIELSGVTIDGNGKGLMSTVAGSTLEAFDNALSTIAGQATITNNGTLEADYAKLMISGAVNGNGTLEADNANLMISGAVNGTGTIEATSVNPLSGLAQHDGLLKIGGAVAGGNAIIDGTGEIEFGSASKANVQFTQNSIGILRLDDSTSAAGKYTGEISGFGLTNAPSAVIDLVDLNFANAQITSYTPDSAANTSGKLTITSGKSSVTLHFAGTYTKLNFNIVDDGNGGTELTDPPASDPPQTSGQHGPANLALFVQYMASSLVTAGADHGGGLHFADAELTHPQPLLVVPHA